MDDDRISKDKTLLIRAQNGDAKATELFLADFVPLLSTIAKRFFNPALSTQDLCQAGYIGLLLALPRYDCTQNVQFMTYAMPWVLGEMKKALRCAVDWHDSWRRRQSITQQLAQLSTTLGREPHINELAKFCKTNTSEIVWALEGGHILQSLDRPSEESGKTILETLIGRDQIDDQSIDLHLALANLSAQARMLIILRYFRDHTQKETAELMSISQSQVSKLERDALEKLRQWLI